MAREYGYDEGSGQVFVETSIGFAKQHGSDWIGEFKTPGLVKKSARRNGTGVRSLQDMAQIQVARNTRALTADHLRGLSWPVAEKLWAEIGSIRGESFHAWRIFASAHEENFNTLTYRYLLEIRQPPLSVSDYYAGLTSPTTSWLTCLRISPKYVDKADLVKIAKIPNLAILDLSDNLATVELTPSRFDERIFRTWAELARHEDAFKHLRVLLFGWQPALSTWIFKYLNDFPALRLLVATACPEFGQWNRKEWESTAGGLQWEARHAKKSVQLMRTVISDDEFTFGAVSSLLFDAAVFGSENPRKPVIECWLGGPPAWENVITAYPKTTQTVWLEKNKGTAALPQPQPLLDQSQRLRDAEANTVDHRSPPPKRGNIKMRQQTAQKTAADLLGDLMKGT